MPAFSRGLYLIFRAQDQLQTLKSETDRLEEVNNELRQDMESCREREAEMLNFTEKLTAKNVVLQSEYAVLEAKVVSCFFIILHIENSVSY